MSKKNTIKKKCKIEQEDSNKLLIGNLIKFINKYNPVRNNKWEIMSSIKSEEDLNLILIFPNLKISLRFKSRA